MSNKGPQLIFIFLHQVKIILIDHLAILIDLVVGNALISLLLLFTHYLTVVSPLNIISDLS